MRKTKWILLHKELRKKVKELIFETATIATIEQEHDLFNCCGTQLKKLRTNNKPLSDGEFIREIYKIEGRHISPFKWSNFGILRLVNQVKKLATLKNSLWMEAIENAESR